MRGARSHGPHGRPMMLLFVIVVMHLPALAFLTPIPLPPTPSRRFVLQFWRGRQPVTLASLHGSPSANATAASKMPPHVPASSIEPIEHPPPPPPSSMESGSSFLHWIITWPMRDLLPEIRPVLLLNVVWTGAVLRLHQLGYISGIDATPHSLLSGALGFFLTFRANEGYARCKEAREVWDGVLNSSRDLLRTAVACESLLGRSRTQRLVDLTCAYGMALESFVCQRPTSSKELDALLTNPGDRASLQLAANGPLAIVELLTLEAVEAGRESKPLAESVHFPRLLGFIDELGHHVTSCQRLMKPPVPPVFYGHAMRFLTLWTFTLPLALLPTLPQWALVPSVGFVTWALFGLRELGVKTQFPFSIGLVKLRDLWKEVVWDARTCYQSSHVKAAAELSGLDDEGRVKKQQ